MHGVHLTKLRGTSTVTWGTPVGRGLSENVFPCRDTLKELPVGFKLTKHFTQDAHIKECGQQDVARLLIAWSNKDKN